MKAVLFSRMAALVGGLALVTMAMPSPASADPYNGKFSSFGATRTVTGGLRPDETAWDLTSNCGNQPYNNACYSTPTPATSPFTYSGVAFTLRNPAALSALKTLSTDYNFGGADCGGGAPRISIFFADNNQVDGYFGPPPNFTGCYYGWLNSGNWADPTDTTPRWDFDDSGIINMDWAQVEATYGSEQVVEIDVILDSGWSTARGQDFTIDTYTVNNNVLQASDDSGHDGGHGHHKNWGSSSWFGH